MKVDQKNILRLPCKPTTLAKVGKTSVRFSHKFKANRHLGQSKPIKTILYHDILCLYVRLVFFGLEIKDIFATQSMPVIRIRKSPKIVRWKKLHVYQARLTYVERNNKLWSI